MVRIEYEKRKAFAHSMSAEEIERRILSLDNREYRVILALTFLTMSRISEICTLRKGDVSAWEFQGKDYLLLAIGVEKRGGFAKLYPLVQEKSFRKLYLDVVGYLKETSKGDPDAWLWKDPKVFTYSRELKLQNAEVKILTETDNLLRKRIGKYSKSHIKLNPHLLRHARYAILDWIYGLTEHQLQSVGGWKREEDMRVYRRYARPEELARSLLRKPIYAH